jgi:hypothetical protein
MTEIGRALRDRTGIDMEDESSQGYIFAANLENPGLMTVFESVLANPVTNKRLTELLKRGSRAMLSRRRRRQPPSSPSTARSRRRPTAWRVGRSSTTSSSWRICSFS